jgi:hypothetical protein
MEVDGAERAKARSVTATGIVSIALLGRIFFSDTMSTETKPQTLREILKWPENWQETREEPTPSFPTVESVLEQGIKAAEYCWGKPLPAEGWRDVALDMRDWARKLDDMRKGAADANARLIREGVAMQAEADARMSAGEIEAACGVDVAIMVETAVLRRRAALRYAMPNAEVRGPSL